MLLLGSSISSDLPQGALCLKHISLDFKGMFETGSGDGAIGTRSAAGSNNRECYCGYQA